MGFAQVWQRMREGGQVRPYNILAISDIHLGADLRAGGRGPSRRSLEVDQELVRFLDQYAAHRVDDRPWRLLLLGDIVDFVAITLTPEEGEAGFPVSARERRIGLDNEEPKCAWKMARTARRHPEVFAALGRFLAAGHQLHVVRGNHDAEFHWPAVQEQLRRDLTLASGLPAAAVEAQVQFHAWFYLEPGFFYAEHGNAHDRFCVQKEFFEPLPGAKEITLPLSSQLLRFFVNKYAAHEDLDHADTWGVRDCLAWVWRAGNPLAIAADYLVMVTRILAPVLRKSLSLTRRGARLFSRTLHRMSESDPGVRHVEECLSRFSEESGAQARQLLAIASRPGEQSLFDTAQLFFVDRVALAAAALGLTWLGLQHAPGWSKVAVPVLVGVAFAAANAWLGRQRVVEAHPMLLDAARRVAQIFDVRYVVMGHSHKPVDQMVGAQARYFNLGSWTALAGYGLHHVIVVGRHAEMRRWAHDAAVAPVLPDAPRPPPHLRPPPATLPGLPAHG